MKMTVKMPRAADTVDEYLVSELGPGPGTSVSVGDCLLRVETDKAVVEVPSPVAGVVAEYLVSVDDEIRTGAPIAVLQSS